MKNLASASTLHNAVEMPWFGLGVSGLKDGDETADCKRVTSDSAGDCLGDLPEEGIDRIRRTLGALTRLVFPVLDCVGLERKQQRHRQILEQAEDEE